MGLRLNFKQLLDYTVFVNKYIIYDNDVQLITSKLVFLLTMLSDLIIRVSLCNELITYVP